jgi:hypothetical protein
MWNRTAGTSVFPLKVSLMNWETEKTYEESDHLEAHERIIRPLFNASTEAYVYRVTPHARKYPYPRRDIGVPIELKDESILKPKKGKYIFDKTQECITGHEFLWNATGGKRGSIVLILANGFDFGEIFPHCYNPAEALAPNWGQTLSAIMLCRKMRKENILTVVLTATNGIEDLTIYAPDEVCGKIFSLAESLCKRHGERMNESFRQIMDSGVIPSLNSPTRPMAAERNGFFTPKSERSSKIYIPTYFCPLHLTLINWATERDYKETDHLQVHEQVIRPLFNASMETYVYRGTAKPRKYYTGDIIPGSEPLELENESILKPANGKYIFDKTKECITGHEYLWNVKRYKRGSIVMILKNNFDFSEIFKHCYNPGDLSNPNTGQSPGLVRLCKKIRREKNAITAVLSASNGIQYMTIYASDEVIEKIKSLADSLCKSWDDRNKEPFSQIMNKSIPDGSEIANDSDPEADRGSA